jgi:prophage maintenance system killer protein
MPPLVLMLEELPDKPERVVVTTVFESLSTFRAEFAVALDGLNAVTVGATRIWTGNCQTILNSPSPRAITLKTPIRPVLSAATTSGSKVLTKYRWQSASSSCSERSSKSLAMSPISSWMFAKYSAFTGATPKGSSQGHPHREGPGFQPTAQAAFQHQPSAPAGFHLPPSAALVELKAQLAAAEDATAIATAAGRDLSAAAAGLAHAIAWETPPFARGNAAAAFLAVNLVLELNALYLDVTEQAAVETMGALAAGRLSPAELARWIAENNYPLHRWYL